MPRTAITGYVVFLALAFGLRAILHYRRTGTSGFIGLTGRPGSIEWLAGVLFGVAVVTGGLAPLAQLLGLLHPIAGGDARVSHVAGLLCFGVGLAGTLQAQASMGDSWRIGVDSGERTDLVSRGPFRWVRNPIFTWMSIATVGLVLLTPNALAIASLVILLVALEVQVRAVEEPYLLRTHGASYRKYASTTGRFVPGIGRLCDE
jgi:protein-S-isoprenylcysteine O-methyltransferase Ste14